MTLGKRLKYNARKPKTLKPELIETDIDNLETLAGKRNRMAFDGKEYNILHLRRSNQLYKI